MTVQHHLDETTIIRFASGDLDEAFAVIVASHIDMCSQCRKAIGDAEAVGGNLLGELPESAMKHDALDQALATLDEDVRSETQPIDPQFDHGGDVPKPLRRFIGSAISDIPWSFSAPGIRRHVIDLDNNTGSSLYLLKIAAGKAVPEHGHGGSEMTLVLQGKYRDALGVFAPGDIEDLDEHIEHQPKVEPDMPCICLVATEAPTRFKGFFSRMLQPLVGI